MARCCFQWLPAVPVSFCHWPALPYWGPKLHWASAGPACLPFPPFWGRACGRKVESQTILGVLAGKVLKLDDCFSCVLHQLLSVQSNTGWKQRFFDCIRSVTEWVHWQCWPCLSEGHPCMRGSTGDRQRQTWLHAYTGNMHAALCF